MYRILVSLAWSIFFLLAIFIPSTDLFKKDDTKVLNVFTWAEMIPTEVLEAFEKEYGVKVHLHPFTTNEECLVKYNANPGKYDLLGPSDYAIRILIEEGGLQKIDKKRLPCLKNMTPLVLNKPHDPNQEYCVPFEWEVYGMAIDRRAHPNKKFDPSWGAAFDIKAIDYKIAMTPDPFESVVLASHYLYGPVNSLTPAQKAEVASLLRKQRSIVEAYVDYRTKYLFQSQNCSVALTRSTFIWQIAEEVPSLEFILPSNDPIISIENFAIPKSCKKKDLVYKFMNFVLSHDQYIESINRDLMFPVYPEIIPELTNAPTGYQETFKAVHNRENVHFFHHIIPESEIRSIWISAKTP